jgi:DNA primase
MAGLIPQSFIDDMLDRVDIVDVIDSRVKLKKSGKNYSACCPFHDEKTPSFTVSPDKQFYYCFGCGASGNTIGFLMDYERLSFPEAAESLAHTLGLSIPREVQTQAEEEREKERKNIYTFLEKASDFYQQQLRHHSSKNLAVNYLKKRGLDGRIAKAYQIGYAPPGWDNLLKTLAHNDDEKHVLIEGGMLIVNDQEKKLYDRFRYRIMFPIQDTRGRVIGFGGRVLGDDKPKYLNSPETPVFHKGQELYGLYQARLNYRELPRLLVVEGYMDVVSLAQFGIGYAVATLGTACGPDHLDRAFKYTNEVVFCFDGDQAGRTAASRALDAAIGSMTDGRTVKFLFLPEGEDPDTLVRQIGAEKFEKMIESAVPFEDQLFDEIAKGLNIRTMEGRASFSKRAAPLLDRLSKGVFRELMFDSLANRTGLSRKLLDELIQEQEKAVSQSTEIIKETIATTQQTANEIADENLVTPPQDYREFYWKSRQRSQHNSLYQKELNFEPTKHYLFPPAQKAMALLLSYPQLARLATHDESYLSNTTDKDCDMLGRLLQVLKERPHYKLSNLIGHWRNLYGEEAEQLIRVAGHDLLMATHAITQTKSDKPTKVDYDPEVALKDALEKIRLQESQKKNAESLTKLSTIQLDQLTKEDKEAIKKALLNKIQP